MDTVKVRDHHRQSQQEQQQMPEENVGTPEGQLDNLDDEFSGRLRHDVGAETASIPLAGPPCSVGFVVLEFSSQEHRDHDFVDGALDSDDRDETKHRMRSIPKLKEPLEIG
jgi:hypothetical protein